MQQKFPPTLDRAFLGQLAQTVGPGRLLTRMEDLASYAYDGTGLEYLPAAVVFPENTAEVAAILSLASAHRVPVVPRGAGTGMSGGALPVCGGIVLACSRMNRLLEIDTENSLAVVEPGLFTGELQQAVKKVGLFYPPDPASAAFCTIGGNVAECAGGPSAVKYGVTRDYVLALEVVLADGRILNTGARTAKSVAGYDLTRLFVGSEGTLGVVTRITLRLIPLPPETMPVLVMLAETEAATRLVHRIQAAGILPRCLEFMDQSVVELLRPRLSFALPANCRALLQVELDGSAAALREAAATLQTLLEGEAAVLEFFAAKDPATAEEIRQARRAVSPASFSLAPDKLSEDVVVPRSKIPRLVRFAQELAARRRLPVLTFGHAGDGNIHVNIMLDKTSAEQRLQATAAKEELFAEVVALGGSLSGEHGIGCTKSRFMPLEHDATSLAVMRAVKDLFDPLGILNPGKIFPPSSF